MSRCGLEPERYFTHEDFMAIFDFNTPATIGALERRSADQSTGAAADWRYHPKL